MRWSSRVLASGKPWIRMAGRRGDPPNPCRRFGLLRTRERTAGNPVGTGRPVSSPGPTATARTDRQISTGVTDAVGAAQDIATIWRAAVAICRTRRPQQRVRATGPGRLWRSAQALLAWPRRYRISQAKTVRPSQSKSVLINRLGSRDGHGFRRRSVPLLESSGSTLA